MEENFNAVELIQTIANTLRKRKLQNIKSVEKEIAVLGEYLGTNQMQTIVFVCLFDSTASGSSCDLEEMAEYFECSCLKIVSFKKDIDTLLIRGLIEEKKNHYHFSNHEYRVSNLVFETIIANEPISNITTLEDEQDQFDLIDRIASMLESRDDDNVSTTSFLGMCKDLEERFSYCEFVSKTKALLPNIQDRVLFYDICKDNYIDERHTNLEATLRDFYDRQGKILKVLQSFQNRTSALLKSGLVDFWENSGDHLIAPSKQGMELLLGEYANIQAKNDYGLDRYDFVNKIAKIISLRNGREIPTERIKECVFELEEKNKYLPLVIDTRNLLKEIENRIFFYAMCYDSFVGNTCLENRLEDIYDKPQESMMEVIKWQNEQHPLQTLGLAEMGEESLFGGTKVELTDEGRSFFFREDVEKYKRKEKTNDILSVDNIKSKNLFYPPELKRQVDFLSNSIQQEAFSKLQSRLNEQGLPVGVAAIFYGTPGTGKTETVYQLAKASGRDVMQVDISEMKTCWYGESQKLVKGVFSKYERICKKSAKAPILLFNEADAIFSKRLENGTSSVDQTENAIQNIILEQMEKLQGILIATTNLEGNLDPAFERRFLFKIKFEKPNVATKALIWRDKLPLMSVKEAERIASQYDFSGGEIDNIVRKVTMNTVLTGDEFSFDYIRQLCSEEHISKRYGTIGF